MWTWVVLAIEFLVLLRVAVGLLEARSANFPPFRRVDSLLKTAERQFTEVLRRAVSGRYLILAKVRLSDLFHILRRGERTAGSFPPRLQQTGPQ